MATEATPRTRRLRNVLLLAVGLLCWGSLASPARAQTYKLFEYYRGLPADYREEAWEGANVNETWGYLADKPITLNATDKVGADGQLYKCVGWTDAIGITPPSGDYHRLTFTITRDSSITWLYRKAHMVHIAVEPHRQRLYTWGSDVQGQLGPEQPSPAVWSGFTVGPADSWALDAEGELWRWGGWHVPSPSATPARFGPETKWLALHGSRISIESSNLLALRFDGTLWAWGDNYSGELGLGDTEPREVPTQVTADLDGDGFPDNDWASVARGAYHTLGIKADGSLWAWGNNWGGQLGLGTSGDGVLIPTRVDADLDGDGQPDADWSAVAGGGYHTLALKTDGSLWAWGDNDHGELGLGDTANRATPTRVDADLDGDGTPDRDWVEVTAGEDHSLARKADGSLWAWGNNRWGQLGFTTTEVGAAVVPEDFSPTPQAVTPESSWTMVSAGSNYTLGMQSDGSLWAWGYNDSGQLGLGDTDHRATPAQLPADLDGDGLPDTDWDRVQTGLYHTLARKTDGSLWAWGRNGWGQLGDGTTTQRSLPVHVGTDPLWSALAAGTAHTVALKPDGSLWAWGDNHYCQVGDDTDVGRPAPVRLGGGNDWFAVAAGNQHSLALKADGSLWAWGRNHRGQLGYTAEQGCVPARVGDDSDWVSIAAGGDSSYAIKDDGSLWSWGNNGWGQLGIAQALVVDSYTTLTRPAQVPADLDGDSAADTDWAQVAAGARHMLALKQDGTLYQWGDGWVHDATTDNEYALTPSLPWANAETWARNRGAHLLTLNDDDEWWEHHWLRTVFGTGSLWVGYTDQNSEGSWRWATGEVEPRYPAPGFPWCGGEPNNSGGNEDCAHMNYGVYDGCWNDAACWVSAPGIAERRFGPVTTGSTWTAIAAGGGHSLAIRADGTLWAWGVNDYGQLGYVTTGDTPRWQPSQVGNASSWYTVAAGAYHSLAVQQDGTAWAWGSAGADQLGYPADERCYDGVVCSRTPGQVGTTSDWVTVTAGGYHSLALRGPARLELLPHRGPHYLVERDSSYQATARVVPLGGTPEDPTRPYSLAASTLTWEEGGVPQIEENHSSRVDLDPTGPTGLLWHFSEEAPARLLVEVASDVPEAVRQQLDPPEGEYGYGPLALIPVSAPAEVSVAGADGDEVWRCTGWTGSGALPASGDSCEQVFSGLDQDSSLRWHYEKIPPQVTFTFAIEGAEWGSAAPRLYQPGDTAGSWDELPLTDPGSGTPASKTFPRNRSLRLTTELRPADSDTVCTGVRVDTFGYNQPITVTDAEGRKEFLVSLTEDVELALTYHSATRVPMGTALTTPASCGAEVAAVKQALQATFGHSADSVDDAFHWGEWEETGAVYPVRPIPHFSLVCSDGTTHYYADWPDGIDEDGVVVGTPSWLQPAGAAHSYEAMPYSESYERGQWELAGGVFAPQQEGRSLLQFRDPDGEPQFLVVAAMEAAVGEAGAACTVGTALLPPAHHQDPEGRNGFVLHPDAFYDGHGGDAAYDRGSRQGPILPVNASPPAADEEHQLVVVWYTRGNTGAAAEIGWSRTALRYDCAWPAAAPPLVIASGNGHKLGTDAERAGRVYRQPDRALAGYNPNEEHALILGDTLFALRDDLNVFAADGEPLPAGVAETSAPHVLLKHRDSAGDWVMQVFRVLATGHDTDGVYHDFAYPIEAGQPILPLTPMDLLPTMQESALVAGEEWYHRDHKGGHWAKAACTTGGADCPSQVVMHWYYPLQESFDYPADWVRDDGEPVAVGDPVPFLNGGARHADPPRQVSYTSAWPADPPVLQLGETLFAAKAGLPDLQNMAAAEVVFDQAAHAGGSPLALLFDPLSERSVPLEAVPGELRTETVEGKVHFPDLPPALGSRLHHDPLNEQLVFHGVTVESATGEPWLLPNVMTLREKGTLEGLATGRWSAAVDALYTETTLQGHALLGVPMALTAGAARSEGFVVLTENDHDILGAAPVALHVIQVAGGPYRGEIKVIAADNPFDEKLTLRHSGDFGGVPEDLEFAWYYQPDQNGLPPRLPTNPADTDGWVLYDSGPGLVALTIEGAGKLTLSDNWFMVHYNYAGTYPASLSGLEFPGADDLWSPWAGAPGGETAQLAEGWIKRVVSDLNPLDARVTDFRTYAADTQVSMLTQLGERYEGAAALSGAAGNLNSVGLIEAYQTVLDRGRLFSVDAAAPVDYGPTNVALLNAATRIAGFYALLGNEAYADALDPTIGFDTAEDTYGTTAASIHAFQNQVDGLLEEELTLLRGRDDSLATTRARPIYNRLPWNFTEGDGEVAYVQAYNVFDQDVSGVIDEGDARVLYPQGHGDAWGHYLTGMKTWYGLLQHAHYTWEPRLESVLVGNSPVPVDYLDERSFAQVAATKAKVGGEIVNLTYRQNYVEDPAAQWQGYRDPDPQRAWGVDGWARRAGQGAYFDWLVANALLPETDPNPEHSGIQKIDRTTVPELSAIASEFSAVQARADQADAGLNPLGLARGVVPFDIDPYQLTPFPGQETRTHFEQVYARAEQALDNAVAVFDYANRFTLHLRGNQDSLDAFRRRVDEQERDYKHRLIELFGYPHQGDTGPGKTYPSGYDGPDLFHYMYVDVPQLVGAAQLGTGSVAYTASFEFDDADLDRDLGIVSTALDVTWPLTTEGPWAFDKPDDWGQRRAPGALQQAISQLLAAQASYRQGLLDLENILGEIAAQVAILEARHGVSAHQVSSTDATLGWVNTLATQIKNDKQEALVLWSILDYTEFLIEGITELQDIISGLAFQVVKPAKLSLKQGLWNGLMGLTVVGGPLGLRGAANAAEYRMVRDDLDMELALLALDRTLQVDDARFEVQQLVKTLETMEGDARAKIAELFSLAEAVRQAAGQYQALLAAGQRLLTEREVFRTRTAAQVQDQRYQDLAFRVFRNDAVQKYRAAFDLAQRYAYLAATAYDYETNLLGTDQDSGRRFLSEIVRQRAPGEILDGIPVVGRTGLADPLARLRQNFDLYKPQLGFNNPQIETNRFSLRAELFRLTDASDEAWRLELGARRVDDLWQVEAFRRYCRPFADPPSAAQPNPPPQPALVIPFSTEVVAGRNYFGWPLGGGDSAYDPSNFATRIRSVGIWLQGYDSEALSNTPRVYLVPVGADVLRSPSSDGLAGRRWTVVDQKIPVPFPISEEEISGEDWIPVFDTLGEELGGLRRFASLRAYPDRAEYYSADDIAAESTLDTRLVGRSVWNTQWLLILPGATMLADPEAALDRFVADVSDIKLFFQTYAYSGN